MFQETQTQEAEKSRRWGPHRPPCLGRLCSLGDWTLLTPHLENQPRAATSAAVLMGEEILFPARRGGAALRRQECCTPRPLSLLHGRILGVDPDGEGSARHSLRVTGHFQLDRRALFVLSVPTFGEGASSPGCRFCLPPVWASPAVLRATSVHLACAQVFPAERSVRTRRIQVTQECAKCLPCNPFMASLPPGCLLLTRKA